MRASGSPTRCMSPAASPRSRRSGAPCWRTRCWPPVDLSREEGERRLAEAEAALRDGRGVGRRGRGTGAGTHPVGAGAGRGGGRAADRAVAAHGAAGARWVPIVKLGKWTDQADTCPGAAYRRGRAVSVRRAMCHRGRRRSRVSRSTSNGGPEPLARLGSTHRSRRSPRSPLRCVGDRISMSQHRVQATLSGRHRPLAQVTATSGTRMLLRERTRGTIARFGHGAARTGRLRANDG